MKTYRKGVVIDTLVDDVRGLDFKRPNVAPFAAHEGPVALQDALRRKRARRNPT